MDGPSCLDLFGPPPWLHLPWTLTGMTLQAGPPSGLPWLDLPGWTLLGGPRLDPPWLDPPGWTSLWTSLAGHPWQDLSLDLPDRTSPGPSWLDICRTKLGGPILDPGHPASTL